MPEVRPGCLERDESGVGVGLGVGAVTVEYLFTRLALEKEPSEQ